MFDSSEMSLSLLRCSGPVWIQADPVRMTQVIGNLLNNAVKFTPVGGKVTVSVAVEDGRTVVRVRDTGVGTNEELLAHAFDPFVQGDRDLARTRGGLGLGLALVKGVVELQPQRAAALEPVESTVARY